jgi:hypothetical protein
VVANGPKLGRYIYLVGRIVNLGHNRDFEPCFDGVLQDLDSLLSFNRDPRKASESVRSGAASGTSPSLSYGSIWECALFGMRGSFGTENWPRHHDITAALSAERVSGEHPWSMALANLN